MFVDTIKDEYTYLYSKSELVRAAKMADDTNTFYSIQEIYPRIVVSETLYLDNE